MFSQADFNEFSNAVGGLHNLSNWFRDADFSKMPDKFAGEVDDYIDDVFTVSRTMKDPRLDKLAHSMDRAVYARIVDGDYGIAQENAMEIQKHHIMPIMKDVASYFFDYVDVVSDELFGYSMEGSTIPDSEAFDELADLLQHY